jgi:hypothetical protein
MIMTNSLKDILGGRAKGNEPPEFGVIKRYMMKNFKTVPKLAMSNKNIIISVPNAALAGSLRMSLHELKEECKTDKRLIIRIG